MNNLTIADIESLVSRRRDHEELNRLMLTQLQHVREGRSLDIHVGLINHEGESIPYRPTDDTVTKAVIAAIQREVQENLAAIREIDLTLGVAE